MGCRQKQNCMKVQVNFLKNEALGKMTHNLKSFDKGRKCEKKNTI